MRKVDDDIERLTEATRRAHETIKDLKTARRELDELLISIREILHEEVSKQLDALGKRTQKAIEDSEQSIWRRFEACEKLIFEQGKGQPSLEQLISQMLSQQSIRALLKAADTDTRIEVSDGE